MSQRDAFDRILASLHESALDDSKWPATSALIDDACRMRGSVLGVGEGCSRNRIEIISARLYLRGQRHEELEREYFDVYYAKDEHVPRLAQLPDSRVVHVSELFTNEEMKNSAVYNEFLPRSHMQDGLNICLDGSNGSRIVWATADPIDGSGWSSFQIQMVERLLPHVRQYVRVRQALIDAGALSASLAEVLDNTRTGAIQLDRRRHIVSANDRACELLKQGDGLCDTGGCLSAVASEDDVTLQRLLMRAMPRGGGQNEGGSMLVRRSTASPRLVLHVTPVSLGEPAPRTSCVGALVLVVDPASQVRIDPTLVATSLGLTQAESQVAVSLTEGNSVRDIAVATGRREATVRWHIKRILNKQGLSRQLELVQSVLSLVNIPMSRQ